MRFGLARLTYCFRGALAVNLAVAAACSGAARSVAVEPITLSPVQGKLTIRSERGADTALAPVVVMLEPIGTSDPPGPGNRTVIVTSTADLFDPPFVAVTAGDRVILENRGGLQHSFFSPDLAADLKTDVVIPVAPRGQYASVDFIASGTKRLYCSLHPDETFTIFVSATPFYAMADSDGTYLIPDVPDGRYRLAIWHELVSGFIRRVTVDAARGGFENIRIDLGRIGR